ncbi:MAG: sulfatase-like hydrolase/transferase [Lentisphaeraceae bacterium]|nr:sulfatase-like hydrolase/transferase [Lentisphaeraceae bacterium]
MKKVIVCVWLVFALIAHAASIEETLNKYQLIQERDTNQFLNALCGADRNNSGSKLNKGKYEAGSLSLAESNSSFIATASFSFKGESTDRDFIIKSDFILNFISFKDADNSPFPVKIWNGQDFIELGSASEIDGYYYYKVSMNGLAGARARISSKSGAATLQFYVERPNILFVIGDDYGVDTAPAPYKDSLSIKAPNLKSMIKNGTTFSNCWVNPVCSPTRAAVMTGRYGYRNGIGYVVSDEDELSSAEFTLPKALELSPAEYQNVLIGKWHLGDNDVNFPGVLGWNHYSGFLGGGVFNYYSWQQYIDGTGPYQVGSRRINDPAAYTTTVFVNETINWIEENKEKPWISWLALNATHTPLHTPPADLHTYDDDGEDMTDPTVQFKAMIQAMDTELGRLIDYLKQSNELKNTLIIFLGDNGTDSQAVDFGVPQKGSLYEGGIKVPLVMWAGNNVANFEGGNGEQSRIIPNIVNGVDIFTTINDIAGVNKSSVEAAAGIIDGISLLPYLQGDVPVDGSVVTPTLRSIALSERFNNDGTTDADQQSGKTVRNQNYKLIIFGDGSRKLFKASDNSGGINENINLLDSNLIGDDLENYNLLKDYLEPIFNP